MTNHRLQRTGNQGIEQIRGSERCQGSIRNGHCLQKAYKLEIQELFMNNYKAAIRVDEPLVRFKTSGNYYLHILLNILSMTTITYTLDQHNQSQHL